MQTIPTIEPGQVLSNHTWEDLQTGQSDSMQRTLTEDDIMAFALLSGDVNPAHLDAEYAEQTMFKKVIAHGMWAGSLVSCLLGTRFPGPGTIYLEQTLKFRRPVYVGDTLTVTATVAEKDEEKKRVTLDCLVENQNGETVVKGQAQVMPPKEKLSRPVVANLPQLRLVQHTD